MSINNGIPFKKEELFSCLRDDGITASHITINNAKTGNGPALYDIAYEYETELRDYDKAYAWYRLSANKNCNLAQFKIGFLYNHGLGVPLDVILSMKYFLKAAGNSLRESNIQIGNHFVSGRGVNTNPRKALEWYYKANRYHERVKDFEEDGIYLTDDEKKKTIFQLINETEDIMKKEGDAREESLQIRLGMALRKEQELLNETQQKQAKIELMEKQTVNLIKMNTDFITSSQQRQQAAKALEDKLNAVMEEKKGTLASFEQDKQKVESLEIQLKEKEEILAKYQQGDQKMVSAMNENQALKQTVQRLEQQLQEQKNTIAVGQPAVTNNSNGLELQLREKESMIRMLTRENEFSQKASTNYQQASDTTIDTFRSLVKSKDSEIDLLKSNIQAILNKESIKYITLEKEYRDLKRRIDDYPALLNDCSDNNSITTNTRNDNNEIEVRVKAENIVEDDGSTVSQLGDKRRRLSS